MLKTPNLYTYPYIALLFFSFFSNFFSSPHRLLPIYVESELLRSPIFSAGLRTIFLVVGGLFAFPAGKLADDLGAKRVYIIGTVGPILLGIIFLTRSPLLLLILCISMGISFGFNTAGGQSYLLNAASPSVIGSASAGYFLGNTLGTAFGNLLAGPIADKMGYRTLGTITFLTSTLFLSTTALLLPSIPHNREHSSSKPISLSSFIELLHRSEIRFLLGIRYLASCYWGAVTLLIPLLIFRISSSNTSPSTFSAVSLTIAAFFQILIGRFCDHKGRWIPILISLFFLTLSALGLALTANSIISLFTFGIMATASSWSLSTTIPGLLQVLSRNGEKGRVVGITHIAWSAGMLSGNLFAGSLIQWGPTLPFGISVLCCLGAAGCALKLYQIFHSTDRLSTYTS